MLDEIGLDGRRLEMFFLSSAEGARWAEIATEMTERIRELGPNPLRRDGVTEDLLSNVGVEASPAGSDTKPEGLGENSHDRC